MINANFKVIFPEYYDSDDFVQFEVESKGVFMDVIIELNNSRFRLVFYDIFRLKQDYESAVADNSSYFFEKNLVIISKVTKKLMLQAISNIYHRDDFSLMQAE